ncbi:MAG: DUF7218 family protein [Psychroflexus sp.]|uniref:DUF7218 family protein n=1 Tax=Psychroflexus sp. S27 TaxID=1982757 RepID=UPI000C2B169E|nr:Rho termination factor N-terminal domain-containing protein [Psychroflexus sp. S27]PJX25131.1 Rho termination factor [Psychroflexus sp. S27]
MVKDHGNQIKNDEQYEALRDEGMSKEKSARIANTEGAGEKGGESKKYEKRTKKELDEKAKEIGIEGYSQMTKDELIDELRNH